MTISTEHTPLSYNGDGSTVNFAITWKYSQKAMSGNAAKRGGSRDRLGADHELHPDRRRRKPAGR